MENTREGAASKPWLARQRREIEGGLAEMARLVAGRQWAVGDRFTRGDIAVGTATACVSLRFGELAWRGQHPELAWFADRLAQRDSFRATLPVAQVISERVMYCYCLLHLGARS